MELTHLGSEASIWNNIQYKKINEKNIDYVYDLIKKIDPK